MAASIAGAVATTLRDAEPGWYELMLADGRTLVGELLEPAEYRRATKYARGGVSATLEFDEAPACDPPTEEGYDAVPTNIGFLSVGEPQQGVWRSAGLAVAVQVRETETDEWVDDADYYIGSVESLEATDAPEGV